MQTNVPHKNHTSPTDWSCCLHTHVYNNISDINAVLHCEQQSKSNNHYNRTTIAISFIFTLKPQQTCFCRTFTAVQINHRRWPHLAVRVSICCKIAFVVASTATNIVVIHLAKVTEISFIKTHVHKVAKMTVFCAWPTTLHNKKQIDKWQHSNTHV